MNFIGIFLFSFKDNNSLDSNEYGRIRMRMVSMCPIHCSLTWPFVGGLMLSQRRLHHHHRHLPKVLHYLLGVFAVNMLMCMCVCVGFASVPISFGFRFYLFGFIVLQSLVSGRYIHSRANMMNRHLSHQPASQPTNGRKCIFMIVFQ